MEKNDYPVYDTTASWGVNRVNIDDWDISLDTAEKVYGKVLQEVASATKEHEPEVLVLGVPQYKALWVYVEEFHPTAVNPEELFPLKVVVVSGPMIHVDKPNVNVLYDI